MTPTIYVPNSELPRYVCNICGKKFREDQEAKWGRHVAQCARDNEETVQRVAALGRQRADPLHQAIDMEALEFQQRRSGRSR
jgi:hypothetical protein